MIRPTRRTATDADFARRRPARLAVLMRAPVTEKTGVRRPGGSG